MGLSKECRRQILASLSVNFNEMVTGLGCGWVAPTLRLLLDHPTAEFRLTNNEASWIASLHDIGRFLCPITVPLLLPVVGRKGALAISSVLSFISFTLIALNKSVAAVYAARVIFGFALGLHVVVASIYLCENLKSTYRGAFAAVSIACFYGGLLIEFSIVNYLTYEAAAYTNAAIAFLAFSPLFLSIETAEHLITKRRYEKAFENFLWLRGKKVATEDELCEFEKLKQYVDVESEEGRGRAITSVLSASTNRKTIILLVFFSMLISATGFDPIMSYASITFTRGLLQPNEFTIVFGTLEFVAAVLGSLVVERMNRRTILTIALLISASMHTITATLFYLRQTGVVITDVQFSCWIFVTITVYSMAFSSSILPILVILRGELPSQNFRSIACTASYMAFALSGFLTAKTFLWVGEAFGLCWNFILYAVMSVASVFLVRFKLPETGGKSLMEIQNAIEMSNVRRQK